MTNYISTSLTTKLPAPLKMTRAAAKTLCIVDAKGGTGKTTLGSNLATALAACGYAVAIIEVDRSIRLMRLLTGMGQRGQAPLAENLTSYALFTNPKAGIGETAFRIDTASIVQSPPGINKGILAEIIHRRGWQAPQPFDFVPGSLAIGRLDSESVMAASSANDPTFTPYTQLAKAIRTISGQYDVIILDTAPSLGLTHQNAILASDYVIPIVFDVDSVNDYDATVAFVQQMVSYAPRLGYPTPKLLGVIYNKFDPTDTDNDRLLLQAYTQPHYPPGDLNSEHLEDAWISLPQLGLVRSDEKRLKAAMNARKPVLLNAPSSEIANDLFEMSEVVRQKIGL